LSRRNWYQQRRNDDDCEQQCSCQAMAIHDQTLSNWNGRAACCCRYDARA
jgi:hypothetical protein